MRHVCGGVKTHFLLRGHTGGEGVECTHSERELKTTHIINSMCESGAAASHLAMYNFKIAAERGREVGGEWKFYVTRGICKEGERERPFP